MKTVWALVLMAFGFGLGFVARVQYDEWQQRRVPLAIPEPPKLPEVKPEKKLPDSFKVTEKQVLEALSEGSSVVKNWDWVYSNKAKVEFVSRVPVADDKVDVVVKVEDTHAFGLLHRRQTNWSGMVKLHYELVVSDKKESIWYAKSAEQLHSRTTPSWGSQITPVEQSKN